MIPMLYRLASRMLPPLIIGVGVSLRLVEYLRNRSLWGDEVAIALNLRFRTFPGLLRPLSYDQTMPVGLLMIVKGFASLFGYSELVLRLPMLLVGCGLLISTWILFSEIFERRIVLFMLAAMAASWPLIYYSSELKQYELDALATVLAMWLGFATLKSTRDRTWANLIVGGAVAMFFSQPVIFILASITIAALLDRRFRTSPVWRKYCIIAAVVWLGIFGLLVRFSYRFTTKDAFMRVFWSSSFISLHQRSDFHDSLYRSLVLLLGADTLHIKAMILGALFLTGLYGIRKKSGGLIAVYTAGPFGLVLLASILKQYPFAPRLLMFSIPLLLLLYACALSLIADLFPHGFSNLAFVGLACLFILQSAIESGRLAIHPQEREATRDIVRTISTSKVGAVYLVFGKYKEWEYYAGDWSQPQVLEQRVDLAYDCLRSAQLDYADATQKRRDGCPDLEFPDVDGRWEEIVGNPQPVPSNEARADNAWAEKEATRIARWKTKSVWLFLPVYNENAINGFPKQRRLLENLDVRIQEHGCRILETDSKGDSTAQKLQCGESGQ